MRGCAMWFGVLAASAIIIPLLIFFYLASPNPSGTFSYQLTVAFEIDGEMVTRSNTMTYRASERRPVGLYGARMPTVHLENGEALGFVIPGTGVLFVHPGRRYGVAPGLVFQRACGLDLHREDWLEMITNIVASCAVPLSELPETIFFPEGASVSDMIWIRPGDLEEFFDGRIIFNSASVNTTEDATHYQWTEFFSTLLSRSDEGRARLTASLDIEGREYYYVHISDLTTENLDAE